MFLQSAAFYFFAGMCLASALAVVIARNPVRSVLFLILSFVSAAGLFILLGAEFLGLILIVVYVGAVAVLFLFVVMMLDIDFAELRSGLLNHLPIGAFIGMLLLIELILVVAIAVVPGLEGVRADIAFPAVGSGDIPNTNALGRILYTEYIHFFQTAGIILLVAMIGTIVLTLRAPAENGDMPHKGIPPTQQMARNPRESIEMRDIESRRGA